MTARLNAAPRRGPALDAFRLIAAVLVVAIHTSPLASVSPLADFWLTRVLARLGVPFFLVTTGYFLARRGWCGLRGFWLRTLGVYLAAAVLYLPLNFYAGLSPAAWLRGFVWEGTFYHLWYFPALLWGVLLARGLAKLGTRPGLAVAAVLYLIGLGGDSYFGLADRIPALHNFYTAVFSLTEYTRNGLFYAPVFLLLGAALAESPKTPRLRPSALGFGLSFAGMTAEGLWLHSLHVQRHDSMYLLLPVCLVFLFRLLLAGNAGRWRAARDASLLVYILHPGCIVAVRGLARALGLWGPLVENSLGHFAAVLALSAAAAALLIRLAPLPRRPDARAWRALDIGALLHNLEVLQQAAGPGRRVMAVVKADAYGHGAKTVARVLQQAGVQDFAVATLAEGIALRKAGIRGRILILGWTDPTEAPLLRRWRLTQTVASLAHGQALAAQGYRLRVQIALDTGMHRLGVPADDHAALAALYALPGLRVEGVFSHLCVSDSLAGDDRTFTHAQANKFAEAIAWLRQNGYDPGVAHLLASYGLLNADEALNRAAGDLVRAGIALYGVHSDGVSIRRALPLRPVLSLKARVAAVQVLAAGETAGYGRAFTAARETRLAVLTIGYADGLPRCLPARGGRVLLHGAFCPMVGRMCMDQLLVDVTDAPAVAPGDTATLLGQDGGAAIPAEELAARCDTITNELLSRLSPRLGLIAR